MTHKKKTKLTERGHMRKVFTQVDPALFGELERAALAEDRPIANLIRVILTDHFAARRDAQTEAAR